MQRKLNVLIYNKKSNKYFWHIFHWICLVWYCRSCPVCTHWTNAASRCNAPVLIADIQQCVRAGAKTHIHVFLSNGWITYGSCSVFNCYKSVFSDLVFYCVVNLSTVPLQMENWFPDIPYLLYCVSFVFHLHCFLPFILYIIFSLPVNVVPGVLHELNHNKK